MRYTMLTTATQQRNSQGNLQGNPQSETPPISIETSPIAPIIDAARIFSLRFTARMKRIGAILIMSVLMVFLAACAGGGGGGGAPGGNGGDDDVVPPREDPISVSNLRVIPDTNNATLTWSNPNVNITQISIIYKLSTADSFEEPINITDSNNIRPSANVTEVITDLTNGANYTFNVALELGGADEGKSVIARKRTLLIGPNLDRDEYADDDPLETDEDGDGIDDERDAFPRNATSSAFAVTNLRVIPDVRNATLIWNNPDAVIANISISYKLSTADNFTLPIPITNDARIARNIEVREMITPLTSNTNYIFRVALELTGTDENKSVMATEITRLIGPNLDEDDYADADPLETDEDEDGIDDERDAFPRNDALTAFAVSELLATPGDESVTLRWNNPNNRVVQIASIDISYKRTGTDDVPMTISSTQTTSGAQNVEETIIGLTNGQSYTFTVSLTLMDPDAGMVGPAPSTSATPDAFTVTGLYGVAGDSYVTLGWNNPDASIERISISYQLSGTDSLQPALLIVPSSKFAANASVQHNISGLTEGLSYDFTVSLILSGPDAGKEGAPPSIRILVNPDYDGDGKNNFADVDADGDGLIEIATAQQLNQSRHNLQGSNFTRSAGGMGDANGCGGMEGVIECNGYELIADIYLTTYTNWQPIGSCSVLDAGRCADSDGFFDAIFDGNSHTINDLTITNLAGSYANAAGLFGAISSTSILRNIHIRSGNISDGGHNVGLLVGYAQGEQGEDDNIRPSIINSSAEGAVDASGDNVGGLVGDGGEAEITSSYAAGGAVSGATSVGGLVGDGGEAEITSSYAAGGAVSGANSVGGLVGFGRFATITSSYAAGGDVSGGENVGGLVGLGDFATITSSYAAGGDVSGDGDFVGGLVGDGEGSTITSSYAASGNVSGANSVGGLVGDGSDATITSSYAAGGNVSGTGDEVGGLVGEGDSAEITSSYAAGGAVSGANNVGGLVGGGGSATITSSYAAGGSVNGTGDNVGGLVGDGSVTTITSSYAAGGAVSGTSKVGGLVGEGGSVMITSSYVAGGAVSGTGNKVGGLVGEGGFATITSSYAAGGVVSGDDEVGGLVGGGAPMTVTASYWDRQKSEQTSNDDDSRGVNKTTSELQAPTSATGIYSTWTTVCDGSDAWNFGTASEYPALNCTPNGFLPQRRQR